MAYSHYFLCKKCKLWGGHLDRCWEDIASWNQFLIKHIYHCGEKNIDIFSEHEWEKVKDYCEDMDAIFYIKFHNYGPIDMHLYYKEKAQKSNECRWKELNDVFGGVYFLDTTKFKVIEGDLVNKDIASYTTSELTERAGKLVTKLLKKNKYN